MKTILPILLLCVIGCLAAALLIGEHSLSAMDIIQVLTGGQNVTPEANMVINNVRLPRALLGLLVGMALALAGVIAQSVLRNPLAEPSLIGINSGAALAALILIVHMENVPLNLLPWFSFAGALVMTIAIYVLSWREGLSSMRLILVGIGLNALAGAGASFLSAFGDIPSVQRAMVWLAGSVYDSNWTKVQILAAWLIAPSLLVLVLSRELDLLAFSETAAKSLGQRVNLARTILIIICALISGAAVSAAGLIAFVGLIAPHLGRILVGQSHIRLLPTSALIGAILVMSSDLVGRFIIAPLQLPVGLMTAIMGAPFFIYLMWRQSHAR